MKRLLLSLLLFLLLPVWAMGATYYASPTGSGTTCSLASPCALNYAIATKAQSGDTVIASAGTYGPFNQITFSGVPKTVTTDGGVVSVSFNSGQNGLYLSSGAAGSTINGITFSGGAGKWNVDNRASNVTISNCIFDTLTGGGIYNLGGTGTVVSKCVFRDVAEQAILNEGGSHTINYSLFFRSGTGANRDVMNSITAGTVAVNNCLFVGGGSRSAVRGSGAGTAVTVNNSTFIASGGNVKYPTATIMQASSATVTVNNSIVGSSMLKSGLVTSGTVTLNDVQQSTDPKWRTGMGYNDAILTLYAVDSNHLSTGSLVHYQTVADEYGVHFTYFPDDTDQDDVSDFTTVLRAFVAAGHDLGCEGKSSSPLDTGVPFTVAYSGAGANPRVVVTYTSINNATVALVTDSGTDATFETGKTQTHHYINEVASSLTAAISAVAGWAATVIDGGIGDYDDVYSYTLKAGTYPVSGDTDIPLDKTGRYFTEEIVNSKSDIEAIVGGGYTVKSFFYPRYKPDDDAAAAIKAAGYTSALSGQDTVYQLSAIATMYSLTNDWLGGNVWWNTAMKGTGYDELTDVQKEARCRAWVRDMALGMKFYGYWYAFALAENSGLPAAEFGWMLSEFKNMGVRILSFAEAQAYIASTSAASGDGYTRAFTQSYDGSLKSGSPAINAGMNSVSGTVTLANSRLSLVDGTAFVDFSAAGTLTPYLNGKLTLTDSAGKKAIGYIKAAGTGETLDSEIITSWTNVAMETLTVSGTDITEATNSASTGSAVVADPIVGAGGLYKFVLGAYTLESGTDPTFRITNQSNASSGGTDELVLSPPSASTSYRVLDGTRYAGYRFSASGSITASGHSLKQVLTPSATGVTITSTPGGTTYNWASVESGFNYNDASGYTYTITDFLPTTDYLGKPIRGLPDIGAYEFQRVGGGLGMGIIY